MKPIAGAVAFALIAALSPGYLRPGSPSVGFKGIEIGAPAAKVKAVVVAKGLSLDVCDDFTKPATEVSTKIPEVGECHVGYNALKELARASKAVFSGKSATSEMNAIKAKSGAYDKFRALGTVPDEEDPSKAKTVYATRIKLGFESSKLAKIIVQVDLNEFYGPHYPLAIQDLLIRGNNEKYGDQGKLEQMTVQGWEALLRTRQPLRHRVGKWKTESGARSEIWLTATKGLMEQNEDGTYSVDPDSFTFSAELELSDDMLGDYFDKARDERPEPVADPTATTKPDF